MTFLRFRNRTTIMSFQLGLRLVVFAVAELAGGHIFKVGGYETVYFASLFICTCGLLYVIMVIPAKSDTNINRSDEY